ncbi:MAG TPA: M48 family metallopeptidase [Gammaproteobacteria bacterium]|nr:M48 family metallopeptidase [Gammaproteobacteria bacterium]
MRFNHARHTVFVLIVFTTLAGCAGPTTKRPEVNEAAVAEEAKKQREFALREAVRNEQRLHDVAWPILAAGRPLCIDRYRRATGIKYSNKHNIPEEMQDAAVSEFDMGENLQILAIAEGSPAALAGLQVGDIIMSVNGESAPVGEEAAKKMAELIKEQGEKSDQLDFVVHREGISNTINVTPVEICDYPVLVVNKDDVNAFADGNNIFVTQGMMDFTRSNNELSLVVAHELAHNNMRHIKAKKTNYLLGFLADLLLGGLTGVDLGIRYAAAQAYSKDFEAEADYVGMYIMARAGNELEGAPEFWRRMGIRNPESIEDNYLASHPSTPERFVALEDSIEEIRQKQETGQELMPNIDEADRQEREPPPAPAGAAQLGLD